MQVINEGAVTSNKCQPSAINFSEIKHFSSGTISKIFEIIPLSPGKKTCFLCCMSTLLLHPNQKRVSYQPSSFFVKSKDKIALCGTSATLEWKHMCL